MKTEREMFEEWFCKNHTGLKPNDLLKFRLPEGYSFKDPIKINLMWEAWKSSASREGYRLVPVEKVMDCLYQISDRSYVDDNVSELKAMIGAVE